MKVRYDLETGEIDQWGDTPDPMPGKAILDGVDEEILQYLTLIEARVVNGQLQYDRARLESFRGS